MFKTVSLLFRAASMQLESVLVYSTAEQVLLFVCIFNRTAFRAPLHRNTTQPWTEKLSVPQHCCKVKSSYTDALPSKFCVTALIVSIPNSFRILWNPCRGFLEKNLFETREYTEKQSILCRHIEEGWISALVSLIVAVLLG